MLQLTLRIHRSDDLSEGRNWPSSALLPGSYLALRMCGHIKPRLASRQIAGFLLYACPSACPTSGLHKIRQLGRPLCQSGAADAGTTDQSWKRWHRKHPHGGVSLDTVRPVTSLEKIRCWKSKGYETGCRLADSRPTGFRQIAQIRKPKRSSRQLASTINSQLKVKPNFRVVLAVGCSASPPPNPSGSFDLLQASTASPQRMQIEPHTQHTAAQMPAQRRPPLIISTEPPSPPKISARGLIPPLRLPPEKQSSGSASPPKTATDCSLTAPRGPPAWVGLGEPLTADAIPPMPVQATGRAGAWLSPANTGVDLFTVLGLKSDLCAPTSRPHWAVRELLASLQGEIHCICAIMFVYITPWSLPGWWFLFPSLLHQTKAINQNNIFSFLSHFLPVKSTLT